MENFFYERCVYESVVDNSLSLDILQNPTETEFMQRRVKGAMRSNGEENRKK